MSLWLQLQEKFRALKPREKLITLYGVVLLCLWLFLLEWIIPNLEQHHKDQQQLINLNSQLANNAKLIQTLTQQEAIDPDASFKEKIRQLEQEEQQVQQRISALTSYFVGSERMAVVLQDVLKSSDDVSVKSVKATPPVPLSFADGGLEQKALVYRHSTQVVLVGSYPALNAVLHRLDQLPWSLGWQQLEYKVTGFPTAELTLDLLTVSDNESYIKL
ncbi:hypothetical protein ACFO3I_00135 [Rheinheimera marina]|uniref:MSHA biogenesis protein MshJ n=1 Tax=Rheinheimera marina TaxID=1774958 RepID=A0ABV9JIV7_9GAMM